MTKEEYLNQLKNNLLSLTTDEQQEALQYYSDYFEEAGDDEKVINELGTPEELAKSIIEKCANALVGTEKSSENKTEDKESVTGNYSDVLFYEYETSSVKSLVLNFGAAEIVMISGNKYCVETRGINKNDLNCYLSNDGVLTVNNSRKLNINFWSHERKSRMVPRILLTVPENAFIEKLKISIGAGNFITKNVSLRYNVGSLDVGAGNLVLNELHGGKLNLRCGMGNLDYTGVLKGIVNIDCGMGSIKLRLKGNESDYSYDAKVGLGDFRFNNEKKSGVCKVLNNARKENHFSVNCGMGSVNIEVK